MKMMINVGNVWNEVGSGRLELEIKTALLVFVLPKAVITLSQKIESTWYVDFHNEE